MSEEHEKFKIGQWGVFIKDNKCLILKAADKNKWELPGGRINVGELEENIAEAAFRREIQEELGLVEFKIACQLDWMIGLTNGSRSPLCRLIYLIKEFSGELKISFEHEEMKWISENEIDNFVYSELINAKKISDILKRAFVLSRYEKK